MTPDEKIEYHSNRATTELDLGFVASSLPAARAHLKLASLHMERLRELAGKDGSPAPLRM